MTAMYNGGNIPNRYIDATMRERCIKIRVNGEFVFRKEIKNVLMTRLDIRQEEIEYIYKEERTREWFVVFRKQREVDRLAQMGEVKVRDSTILYCERLTQQKLVLRIHWLPAYVRYELLEVFFSDYVKVLYVADNWSQDSGVRTGMREVTLVTDHETNNSIPHMVNFNDGIKMLVTCPGRLPLCLKCHCIGHVRRDCYND